MGADYEARLKMFFQEYGWIWCLHACLCVCACVFVNMHGGV